MAAVGAMALVSFYYFLPPYRSFAFNEQTEVVGMAGFVLFSLVIVALGESARRSTAKHKQAEEELRKAQRELELRVAERTAQLEHRGAELAEKAMLLDLANDAIFVRSADGKISYWSAGAERLYGWPADEALGKSPQELFRTEYPIPLPKILETERWEGELRHTKRDGSRIVVASRWTTLRNQEGKPTGWLEINTDVTARKQAEDAARALSGRILTLQDDERRRIARELHDSLGQYLTALKMSLHAINTADGEIAKLVSQCSSIVDQALVETRTISYLLHPPLLDEAGVASAVRWYADGFAQRSHIKVNLDVSPEFGRLHSDVEIALFRAVQECLTNVHRHSGSSAVDIQCHLDGEQVRFEVKDDGRGIPRERLKRLDAYGGVGVGLAGIRERIRQLGGSLDIQSGETGTRVIVTIPLRDSRNLNPPPGKEPGKGISAA
ncbi:MAG: ATP-binding protein [Terriglobales bacterium]